MELDSHVLLRVCGADTDHHTVRLCVDVRAQEEIELQRMIDGARLTLDSGILKVKSIPFSSGGLTTMEVLVSSPRRSPVRVSGRYAAVEVCDMNAGVEVSTTCGRIQLINTV